MIDEYHGHVYRVLKRTVTWNTSFDCLKTILLLRENNQNLGLDAQKDPLIETVLLNTQNACFRWNKRKVSTQRRATNSLPAIC